MFRFKAGRTAAFLIIGIFSMLFTSHAQAQCPTVTFNPDTIISGCLPLAAVKVTATPATIPSNVTSICWDMNDGNGFVCNNANQAVGFYRSAGPKVCTLRVEIAPGNFCTFYHNLTINGLPDPTIDTLASSPTPGFFSCQGSVSKNFGFKFPSGIVNSSWALKDPSGNVLKTQVTSTGQFSYTFTQSGLYSIKAVAFDQFGCVKDTTQSFQITILSPITGSYNPSQNIPNSTTTGCLPKSIAFTPSFNIPTGTTLVKVRWVLNNTTTTTQQVFTFTSNFTQTLNVNFNTAGRYTMTLYAYAAIGTDTCTYQIGGVRNIDLETAPVPSFTVNGGRSAFNTCFNQQIVLQNTTPNFSTYLGTWGWLVPNATFVSNNATTGRAVVKYSLPAARLAAQQITLIYNGPCKAADTLRNLVTVRPPLAAISLLDSGIQAKCATPAVYHVGDSTSLKTTGNTYSWNWTILNATGTVRKTISDSSQNNFWDTLLINPDKVGVQLVLRDLTTGCADTARRGAIFQTATPVGAFTNLPPNGTAILGCLPTVYDPKVFIADPGPLPFFYKIVITDATNNVIYSSPNGTPYSQLSPVPITTAGTYVVRQWIGLDRFFSNCLDTSATMRFQTKNYEAAFNLTGLPTGACRGTSGSVSQSFNIIPNTSTMVPPNQGGAYTWTVSGPSATGATVQTPSTGQNLTTRSVTFTEDGVWTVSVTIVSDSGCTVNLSQNFEVGTFADWAAPDTIKYCVGKPLNLNGSGRQGFSFNYTWNSIQATNNNPGTATIINPNSMSPTVVLNNTNLERITFTVTNDRNCTASVTKFVQGVNVKAKLMADTVLSCFPAYIWVKIRPLEIDSFYLSFIDTVGATGVVDTVDIQGTNIEDSVLLYIQGAGTRTLYLTIKSIYGCYDTDSLKIRINGPQILYNILTAKNGCDPLEIKLKDFSRDIQSFQFAWGDGTNAYSLGDTNTHIYRYPYSLSTAPSYTYRTTFFAIGQGCVTERKDSFIVYPRPIVRAIAVPDTFGCSPFRAVMQDTSVYAPLGGTPSAPTFRWDYGDGSTFGPTSTTKQAIHTYSIPGIYTVKLYVTSPYGCIDSNTAALRMNALDTPIANFTVNKPSSCWNVGNSFIFRDSSTYRNSSNASWNWSWTDPTSNPASGYSNKSFYPNTTPVSFRVNNAPSTPVTIGATLIVTNVLGCSDTITKTSMVTIDDTVAPAAIGLNYVTVQATPTPRNQVELYWSKADPSSFSRYNIFRNGTALVAGGIPSINTTTFTDGTANVFGTVYNYQMSVADSCGIESIKTGIHSNMLLTVVPGTSASGYGLNTLSWNAYNGWGSQDSVSAYEIYRAKNNGSFSRLDTVRPVAGLTTYNYVDSNLCPDLYTYYIKALYYKFSNPLFGYYSLSNDSSGRPIFAVNTTAITPKAVSVDNGKDITFKWEPAAANPLVVKQYVVDRWDAGQFSFNAKTVYKGTALSFTDVNVNSSTNIYNYIVRFEDVCGNTNVMSDSSRNILLSSKIVPIAGYKDAYNVELNWTPYGNWTNGVIRYEIQVRGGNGWTRVATVPSTQLTYTDVDVPRNDIQSAYCYRILAIENDAVPDSSLSNESCVYYPSKIIVPSAFTPNNDGLNDEFFVIGAGLKSYNFRVYDRWGHLVWETDDITKGWNGRVMNTGKVLPVDVYSYTILARGYDTDRYNLKGVITIMK